MLLSRHLMPVTGNPLGTTVIVLDSLFLFFSAIALGLRIWSRRINKQALCFNDYAIVLAWPFTAGLVVTAIMAVLGGGGRHLQHVDLTNVPAVLQGYVAADMLWASANTLIKLSILHLYIQIFPRENFCKVAYAVMALVVSFGIGIVLMQFLLCRPFAKEWNQMLPGTCGDSIKSVIATGVINMCIDTIIILLPMPILWRLQMNVRRKIELTMIFGLGTIIVVVTIFRVITATQDRVDDFTYGLAKLAICTDLEPLLGMINACMPVLQPALRRVLHTERSRSSPSRKVAFPGSTTKLNSDNKSKGSKFRQIEDSYMLTDTTGTTNTYVGTASRPNSIGDEESLSAPPAITVQREWEVVSGK